MPKSSKKSKTTVKPKSKSSVKVTQLGAEKASSFSLATLALVTVIEFGLAYAFASWAIDNGSLWLYLLTFVSLYLGFNSLVKFGQKLLNK